MIPDLNIDRMLDSRYQALCSEAEIAAEQMATGATLLGKAHSAQPGLYSLAFFSLSIGMERAAKLAYMLDYCFENGGSFPTNDKLKKELGHDLRKLIENADQISHRRRGSAEYGKLPRSPITEGMIDALTEFAKSTRYYNLDLLAHSVTQKVTEPMKLWYERVGKTILDKHYKAKQKARHHEEAIFIAEDLNPVSSVMFTDEEGRAIDTYSDAFLHSSATAVIQRYSRMYSMQINRFLGMLLSDLGHKAYYYRYGFIPHMADFFAIFNNDDDYFLRRKNWSIYKL